MQEPLILRLTGTKYKSALMKVFHDLNYFILTDYQRCNNIVLALTKTLVFLVDKALNKTSHAAHKIYLSVSIQRSLLDASNGDLHSTPSLVSP